MTVNHPPRPTDVDDPAGDASTVDSPGQRRQILIGVCIALMAVSASVSGLNLAAGDPASTEMIRAAKESFVDGWQQAMWAGAAVMGLLFIHILARGPKHRARTTPSETNNRFMEGAQ